MPAIRALGAELVAVSPQVTAKSAITVKQRKLGFDILRDEGNQVANTLGIRFRLPKDLRELYLGFGIDLVKSNGESSGTLAMPARYVVDSNRVIRDARVHPDYTRRPEPEETLDVLRSLSDGGA